MRFSHVLLKSKPKNVLQFRCLAAIAALVLLSTLAACDNTNSGGGNGAVTPSTPPPNNPPEPPVEPPVAPPGNFSHSNRFDQYVGSATCLSCHEDEVKQVHASVHYQWQGPAPDVVNMDAGGKLGGINDFCIYPDINFIGQMVNLDGQTVSGGCAQCHVGMGEKPRPTASPEQLENIDCLVCHSDKYKRKVVQNIGGFSFAPAPEKMQVELLEAITDISLPGKDSCLNCHATSGGGNNNKRGDLEAAHRNPPSREFDVHMASKDLGGAGLNCVDCHTTVDHKMAGRGIDLRPTDLDAPISCAKCHSSQPHQVADLNKHTNKVECTVCHIPVFAKVRSTDMFRDFSAPPEVDAAKRLYEPHITREASVRPVYRFSDRNSRFYLFGTRAEPGPSGRVVMAEPTGGIDLSGSKLYPFKRHLALQPYDLATGRLLPAKMGILFQKGDVDAAVLAGATAIGWDLTQGYDFMPTERYMGLYHEVSPPEAALACNDCHFGGDRLDFAQLGYTPKAEFEGKPVCASCHEDKSGQWNQTELFEKVHKKHVTNKKLDCASCHNFSRAL